MKRLTCLFTAGLLHAALALSTTIVAGCESTPPPPGGVRYGVPDGTHAPSADGDIDGDGIADGMDNCPSLANADQRDVCAYPFPPPAPTGVVVEDAVERLNFWREMLGLEPVVEDPMLTRGCEMHLDYLLQYAEENMMRGYLSHEEDLSLPYASEEGAAAGGGSVLSYGTADIGGAIDGWLQTLYHRLPLIHPGLQRIGVAYDNRYACLYTSAGTDGSIRAEHPVLWPLADTLYTDPFFGGAESPCPTADDPLGGGECPMSATIPTIGLHGRALSGVTGTFTRLDTGEQVPIFRTYYGGGPSPHEQMGYVEGTIALVPEPLSMLVATTYEVRIDATVDGAPETYRWRFRVGGAVRQDVACDVFGRMNFDFARAVDVTAASFNAKICGQPMFFHIRDAGNYRISLEYDPRYGNLDLFAYDGSQAMVGSSEGEDGAERIENVPGDGYIEVRGADDRDGGYILLIEAMP